MSFDIEKLTQFFEHIHSLSDDKMVELVENNIPDDAIEFFIDHINQFYGIEDEEQLGLLAQLMVVGFLAGKHHFASLRSAPLDDDTPSGLQGSGKKNVQ